MRAECSSTSCIYTSVYRYMGISEKTNKWTKNEAIKWNAMQYQQSLPWTDTGGEGLYVFGSISAKEKRRNRVPSRSAPESGFPPVLSHKYGVHHHGVLAVLGDGYRHMRPQLLLSWCHLVRPAWGQASPDCTVPVH